MAKPLMQDNADDKDSFIDELKPGTKLLHGQYVIDSFLNAGGFGITYLARDSLDRKIVIKECFPGAFCRRSRYIVQARSRAHQNELKSIVRLFVQEARSLAKLSHPNIVGVHQVFEDNDTAYMALDFVEGRDLLDRIEDPKHSLTPAQIKPMLKDMLDAVGFIHDQGILHRDISPDNILIGKDMRPVLIDFGAAREEATKQSRVLSALRVVKDGYSPQEFYIAGSDQGPSSDLYALAATFHHLIAKDVPPNSQARLAAIASGDPDPYVKLAGRIAGYDAPFLAAIDKALEILPKDRLQSAKAWRDMMEGAQDSVTPDDIAVQVAETDASQTGRPRSKAPLLLGSAAVVALLVGTGIFVNGAGPAPAVVPVSAAQTASPQTTDDTTTPAPVVTADVLPEAQIRTPTPPAMPAEMPQPVPEPDVTAALPVLADLRPAARIDIATVTLPDTPDMVDAVGTGPVVDIAAIVPGNEVQPSAVTVSWTVDIPFAAADVASNIIATAAPDAPVWAQAGLVIIDVNGVDVTAISDIPAILRAGNDPLGDRSDLDVTFGTMTPATGQRAAVQMRMPVVHVVALSDGTVFETRFADQAWQTVVTDVPSASRSGLQQGDIVTSYIPTAETLDMRDSLPGILTREIANGTDRFMFAVKRDGSMWVASVDYADAAE
ncbi:MAG: protein kinase [Loktanella sp.]|nr:protein kinase [Loktanella sp.]